MVSIFWDSQGVIIIDYLEKGRTINNAYYSGKLRLRQEITKRVEKILQYPPYSPDMAPSDFYLFPKLKYHLRGTQYRSNECVINAVNEYLGDQENAFYFEGISKPEQRWAMCIALKGYCMEK